MLVWIPSGPLGKPLGDGVERIIRWYMGDIQQTIPVGVSLSLCFHTSVNNIPRSFSSLAFLSLWSLHLSKTFSSQASNSWYSALPFRNLIGAGGFFPVLFSLLFTSPTPHLKNNNPTTLQLWHWAAMPSGVLAKASLLTPKPEAMEYQRHSLINYSLWHSRNGAR